MMLRKYFVETKYHRFAVQRDQRQRADGGVGRSTAEGEV